MLYLCLATSFVADTPGWRCWYRSVLLPWSLVPLISRSETSSVTRGSSRHRQPPSAGGWGWAGEFLSVLHIFIFVAENKQHSQTANISGCSGTRRGGIALPWSLLFEPRAEEHLTSVCTASRQAAPLPSCTAPAQHRSSRPAGLNWVIALEIRYWMGSVWSSEIPRTGCSWWNWMMGLALGLFLNETGPCTGDCPLNTKYRPRESIGCEHLIQMCLSGQHWDPAEPSLCGELTTPGNVPLCYSCIKRSEHWAAVCPGCPVCHLPPSSTSVSLRGPPCTAL